MKKTTDKLQTQLAQTGALPASEIASIYTKAYFWLYMYKIFTHAQFSTVNVHVQHLPYFKISKGISQNGAK